MREVEYQTLAFMCSIAKKLKPKPPLTVSEWAERYMILPSGSSVSGHYSTDTVPYQKEIMDAIADPETQEVTVMSSAQVGKTLIITCGIAYYIDYEPATQMFVMPTIADAERFSKTRFAQLLADVPQLTQKVAAVKTRSSGNTILLKSYPGGNIALSGANSPSSLASDPRRIIWMDEVDRFPESAGTEGNPILLAEKRATSYWNKKFIKTSTPTTAGRSKIEDSYKEGTMETWNVQCPECGAWQQYDFERINQEFMEMACAECGCAITERQWKESTHKWIAEHPERKKHRSFHLNELASPFVDWEEIVDKYKKAMQKLEKFRDPQDLKVFVNTSLGKTWDESRYMNDTVTEETLASRAEEYEAEIPEGVIVLTAAVDIQDDRFEIEVRGWAREWETWGIYKTELYGDLITDAPWDELEAYLSRTFRFASGAELGIAAIAIDDGGHFTNRCRKWVVAMNKKGKWRRVDGVKGYNGKPDLPLLYRRSVAEIKEDKPDGRTVTVGRTVVQIIGVDSGKDDISNRLKIEEPGAGYCHFPADTRRGYGDAYYEGLVSSEYRTEKNVNGYLRATWVQKKGTRNEPLDLFNYNYAAEELLRPDWDALEEKLQKGINYMAKTAPKKRKAVRRTTRAREAY